MPTRREKLAELEMIPLEPPVPEFEKSPLIGEIAEDHTKRMVDMYGRLTAALETIAVLQKRLTDLEVFTHNLSQQRNVALETMERQTRHSALQLAITAAGPGAGSAIIPLYEQFLPILRGTLH